MITVQNVLTRPLFQNAYLAAGLDGTDRRIHWVHVGEVPNLGDFLQGHELVLATGVGLTSRELRTRFLMGLIEANASGLVIELGGYLHQIPSDMIALANQYRFPIVVFPQAVRFLDLSQDINGLVISQHHRMMDDLETLSLKIRQALLNTEGAAKIVQLLYESILRPTIFRSHDDLDPPIVFGPWPTIPGPFEDIALHPIVLGPPHPAIRQTVLVFEKPIGDLLIAEPGNPIDERIYLAVDRTTAALAQDFIRTESLDRTRRREEAALLEHLLFEAVPAPYQIQRFRSRFNLNLGQSYRVIVFHQNSPALLSRIRRQLTPILTLVELDQTDRVILVVIGGSKYIASLPNTLTLLLVRHKITASAGISTTYSDPANLHEAFSEASDAAATSRCQHKSPVCYNTMGIFRWILATSHHDLERLVIGPELGSLLQREDAARLLSTLEALLFHIDSKQAASAALGIHRQTLYARMRTLAHILGDDFLEPERRLALQAALAAWHYTHQPETDFTPFIPPSV